MGSGAAHASTPAAPVAAAKPCVKDTPAQRSSQARSLPGSRLHRDTSPVTAPDIRALPAAETRARYVNREVRPRLAARVNIPVYAHVIKGKHKGERNPASRKRVRNLVAIL